MEVALPVCPNCGRQVPYQQVSTNVNGNQGRLLAKCNKWIHPVTKIQCNFFRWYPSSRCGSQSLSPTLPSSSQLHPVDFFPPPLALSQRFTLPPAPSQVATSSLVNGKCLTSSCNSTRIRKGCTHQRCKHHCKERGGCLSHGNIPLESILPTPHSLPISSTSTHIFTDPPLSSVIDPSLWSSPIHIPLAITQPPAMPVATRALSQAVPTHVSHMLPVFTEWWAMEHGLREAQRKQDAAKLGNLQKTKHTVFIYVWLQVLVD
ncbi:hypothetical protein BYT27DRAFT_7258214 [Phlegmacium glaucopus]|nr:hypothetical protein BYT27DRAFT_7258214 [Phlegmacium glaucopus]